MENKSFLTTNELASKLGVSRVTVFNWIKEGKLKAELKGNTYLINEKDVLELSKDDLSEQKKEEIEKIVDKAVEEYGETFKLLGKE